MAVSTSPRSGPDSALSTSPRTTPSAGEYWQSTGQAYRCGRTYVMPTTPSQQPLSLGDTHVRVKVQPASLEAKTITVGSGLKCSGLLPRHGPLGCLARMLVTTPIWASRASLLTWKPRAIKHGRLLIRLRVSGRGITESEYSLLPTLLKWDAVAPNLRGKEYNGTSKHAMKLMQGLRLLPALTANTGRNKYSGAATGVGRRQDSKHHAGTTLQDLAYEAGGNLSPEWCEWFQGFAVGWSAHDR